ncbi:MAG: hypothetical protein KBG15_15970 [Kofleriaceae bacterium]|nr:hypothetical protein [Kofleriaceae bacterium]
MRFPLTVEFLAQAKRFELRSACCHCLFWHEGTQTCWHGWPDEGQRRWPLDTPDPQTGTVATAVAFCKEFELR